jgi:tyrosine-protein phosphatase SIW14
MSLRRLLIIVVVVTAVGVVVRLMRERQTPKRLAVVEPGVLYRSAQPTTSQLRRLIETYGIKTLVMAREGGSRRAPDEMEVAASMGVRVVHLPLASRQPISDEHLLRFREVMADPAAGPVLVHCSAGKHRTGLLCALYRVEKQEWSPREARREMLSFGFDTVSARPMLEQFDALCRSRPTDAGGVPETNRDRAGAVASRKVTPSDE